MDLLVHAVGLVLLVSGLALFTADQLGGRGRGEAGAAVWRFQISGPPALLLIALGVAVFLFPLGPWWSSPPPGDGLVAVPDVRGDPGRAEDVLAQRGLAAHWRAPLDDVRAECESQGRPVVVTHQDPGPGAELPPGEAVELELGCG